MFHGLPEDVRSSLGTAVTTRTLREHHYGKWLERPHPPPFRVSSISTADRAPVQMWRDRPPRLEGVPGPKSCRPNDCRIDCKTASHSDGDRGVMPIFSSRGRQRVDKMYTQPEDSATAASGPRSFPSQYGRSRRISRSRARSTSLRTPLESHARRDASWLEMLIAA